MNAPGSQRPERDADLDAAYARAHALAGDGRGPAASVRANVLAAAQEAAAQARAAPALAPVATPVAAVGRGRALAVNLSSWRVRSGAAVCAVLLVGLGVWRFDANHRADGGVQVATAALELAAPPTRPLARDLPVPPLVAASTPYVAPPPVVDDPVARTPAANVASAKVAPHDNDRDVIVAQAETSDRAPRLAAPEARVDARRAAAPVAPPVRLAMESAPPAPVAMAPEAPLANAPARSPGTQPPAATARPQLTTLPPMPPSVVPRRVAVAPDAATTSAGDAKGAAAEPQRLQVTASSLRRVEVANAAPAPLDAAKPASPAPVAAADGRTPPAALQAAADRGDVEALRALLAAPTARVDAPDAAGRTALLHAVLAQQIAAVRLLLAAGADPGRADQAGLTPRAAAQAGANAEIAGLLAAPR